MDFSFLPELSEIGFYAVCFFSTYFVLMLFLSVGLARLPFSNISSREDLPTVTVLVSSRNEERDLPDCISSLEKLNYPKEKLQVVLVNDRSTDKTEQFIEEASQRNDHFIGLNTTDYPHHNLEAKARGIALGFRYAIGEWVFITDADAIVHPEWLKASLAEVDEHTGMVGGALMVEPISWLAKLERVCWAFVQMFNLGMSGWGIPFVCVGPNMAIRKSIYDEAGGLEKRKFTIAEDLALFKMVIEAGYKVKTYMDERTVVRLKPVPSFRHLISQQRRWLKGGLDDGILYLIILGLAFGWGLLVSSYILFGWLLSLKYYLIFTATKLVIDILFLCLQRNRMKASKYVRYVILLEIYVPIICFILPISFLFSRKIYWKGDGYEIPYS